MPEPRAARRATVEAIDLDDPHRALRQLGARAHQLRAATHAADHFNAGDSGEDHDTGSWLMSSASALSSDLAGDFDALARALRARSADAALRSAVAALRMRAHQLHAVARAADHFLDLDTHDGRDTGGWLIATAAALAHKLACEVDDCAMPALLPAAAEAGEIEPHDAGLARRLASAAMTSRGAA